MTKEERKAAYNRAWNKANKEYYKAYRKENKEKQDAYNKAYRESNKEKANAYSKVYYQDNKEERKAHYESLKDGHYTVYYLNEEHYAGMTIDLRRRLIKHKSRKNRHIEDIEIVGKYETKEKALRVEAALHAMGYLGRNPQLKNKH